MYQHILDLIGYTGSNVSNIDEIVVYGSIILTTLFSVTLIDLLYRLIRGICKKGDF